MRQQPKSFLPYPFPLNPECGTVCHMNIKALCEKHNVLMPADDCWLWPKSVTDRGYGRIKIWGKTRRAHRVSYEIVNGPIPEGMQICHKCDVPACMNPDHLFIGTQLDNIRDMIAKGRKVVRSGITHPSAKITIEQFNQIKADPRHSSILAKEYGLHKSYVDGIKNGSRKRRA